MNDLRTMVQDELRQALARLMPPPTVKVMHTTNDIPYAADVSPTTIFVDNNIKGQPLNVVKVMLTVQMKKKNIRNTKKKNYPTWGI